MLKMDTITPPGLAAKPGFRGQNVVQSFLELNDPIPFVFGAFERIFTHSLFSEDPKWSYDVNSGARMSQKLVSMRSLVRFRQLIGSHRDRVRMPEPLFVLGEVWTCQYTMQTTV